MGILYPDPYEIQLCTACWNNAFDLVCRHCGRGIVETPANRMFGLMPVELIPLTIYPFESIRDQIYEAKRQYQQMTRKKNA
jgi:hypothetical protein